MTSAAVVVHFGPRSATERALRALAETAPETAVTVVDNAGDLEREKLPPRVRLLSPGRNLGYGAACNLGGEERRPPTSSSSSTTTSSFCPERIAGARDGPRAIARRRGRRAPAPRLRGPTASASIVRRARRRAACSSRRSFFRACCREFRSSTAITRVRTSARTALATSRPLSGAVILVRRQRVRGDRRIRRRHSSSTPRRAISSRGCGGPADAMRFEPAARAVHHGGVASAPSPQAELDRRLARGPASLRPPVTTARAASGATARALRLGARLRLWIAHLRPGQRGRERRRRYADILRRPRSR